MKHVNAHLQAYGEIRFLSRLARMNSMIPMYSVIINHISEHAETMFLSFS